MCFFAPLPPSLPFPALPPSPPPSPLPQAPPPAAPEFTAGVEVYFSSYVAPADLVMATAALLNIDVDSIGVVEGMASLEGTTQAGIYIREQEGVDVAADALAVALLESMDELQARLTVEIMNASVAVMSPPPPPLPPPPSDPPLYPSPSPKPPPPAPPDQPAPPGPPLLTGADSTGASGLAAGGIAAISISCVVVAAGALLFAAVLLRQRKTGAEPKQSILVRLSVLFANDGRASKKVGSPTLKKGPPESSSV